MQYISVQNANTNNLKNICTKIPLGQMVAFVGKSGSGKSTLATEIIRGYLSKLSGVVVPTEPALFRQRVSIPKNDTSNVSRFLCGKCNVADGSVAELLQMTCDANLRVDVKLSDLAVTLGVSMIAGNKRISELSLTTFNKIRFLKFLSATRAKLLIVDEMAAGMSYAEAKNVVAVFRKLIAAGYSLITIEHSLPIIFASEYIVEMGPSGGSGGGYITFSGTNQKYRKTQGWKNLIRSISVELPRNNVARKLLKINKINHHGLRVSEFSIPSNCIINVCGLAGTGKSTLLDVVFRAFDKSTSAWKNREGIEGEIGGKGYIRRPYFIDQSPIGINPTSTPATYTKIMDILRNIYVQSITSKSKGLTVSDFSYLSSGKCSVCGGKGDIELAIGDEMVYEPCGTCKGHRYRKDISEVLVNGLSIGDALKLPCGDLKKYFHEKSTISSKIGFIIDVGLSYLTLGQPSSSLSGGESQRIKITKELAKKLGDRCLFILDTPSRGLHVNDFDGVFFLLRKLVTKNNSLILSDNNPYFIRNSDWVVYLDNGRVVYQGTPEKIPRRIIETLGIEEFK